MKIAIIGTRGIPNRYGGFEQFAEIVSQQWVEKGHEVICYNPHDHFYNDSEFNGVKIIKKYNPESKIGAAANFLYDYLCLKDAYKQECDIYLELGYQSASISFLTIPKEERKKIVTNMDGLEWKRDKWSPTVKRLTKVAEKLAVKHSGTMISDNEGIADYYLEEFNVETELIAYGCEPVGALSKDLYVGYVDSSTEFDLVIARLEPENSIEVILEGVIQSDCETVLLVVGNYQTTYGKYLMEKYNDKRIYFVGGIFDKQILDSMRQYCRLYFHGHTVGGTNPSLLEAMAASANIVANDNKFNRAVLNNESFFFVTHEDIKRIRESFLKVKNEFDLFNIKNKQKIEEIYTWETIGEAYLEVFERIVNK
ncbi:glycosyl transferase [Thalassotalea loyana]|uniref:Glycosyl transferase n=1 Tax=Thalassotalea loyana TaxID=280483 RepID=A0ABQ6HF91_9GAMM|nr:DUF1972 domain-containing protein [Thalassotalea loyana]GLX86654.1 glycosyl transferase [Thalassotalea loyana]